MMIEIPDMNNLIALIKLPLHTKASIICMKNGSNNACSVDKLSEMGFNRGVIIEKIGELPFNGAVQIFIRGTRIAIGRALAEKILVKVL